MRFKYLQSPECYGNGRYKVCIVSKTRKKLITILEYIRDRKFLKCKAIKYSKEARSGYVGFAYFNDIEKALNIRKMLYAFQDMYVFVQDDKPIFKSTKYRGRKI